MNKIWGIVLTAVIIAVFVGGGEYLVLNSRIVKLQKTVANNLIAPPQPSPDYIQKMATWKEYKSTDGKFSFKYPSDWVLSDNTSTNTAVTTTSQIPPPEPSDSNIKQVTLQTPSQAKADKGLGVADGTFLFGITPEDLLPVPLDGTMARDYQQVSLNGLPVEFSINLIMFDHYQWRTVDTTSSNNYTISLMTPDGLFNSKSVVTLDEYQEAVDVAYSFTVSK